MWLDGVHIPPYQFAHGVGAHDPDRSRKLLLHAREIERLAAEVAQERLSLVPLALLLQGRQGQGRARRRQGPPQGRQAQRDGRARRQREIERALGRQAKGRTD